MEFTQGWKINYKNTLHEGAIVKDCFVLVDSNCLGKSIIASRRSTISHNRADYSPRL